MAALAAALNGEAATGLPKRGENPAPGRCRHLNQVRSSRFQISVHLPSGIRALARRNFASGSYEYDHRSLAEDLAAIDLPPDAVARMGPQAQEALRMIIAGKIAGPITDEFRHIQQELGDNAAFDYLHAEADGLHVT